MKSFKKPKTIRKLSDESLGSVRRGMQQVARGESVDRGSFAKYVEEHEEES